MRSGESGGGAMGPAGADDVRDLRIGEKIRSIRASKGLGAADVAAKAGITEVVLGQIENDVVAPPIGTLLKIARALEVPLATFFQQPDEYRRKFEVVRAGERHKVRRAAGRSEAPVSYSYEALAFHLPDRHMEPFLVEFDLDADEQLEAVSHAGEEFLFVLEGEIEFRSEQGVIVLRPGDSLYFDSSLTHALRGIGHVKPKAIAVVYSGRQ
ncbi:MAG: cupin domain-containing protein [Planctomycetota bacterium]|nr:cupin domain-containing protein [Planctomycetota bacterium]